MSSSPQKSVSFITLGCAKNEVDSQAMAESLSAQGFFIVEEPEFSDVIIINTCAFIQPATEESIEAILDAAALTGVKDGSIKLVVAGCLPARYKEDLSRELPEVDRFVPCKDEDSIVSVLKELFPENEFPAPTEASAQEYLTPWAYVKISDGCDRFCSYCTIPYIRGRYHSFSYETIKEDVIKARNRGAKEINLIAQDTGRWGSDFEQPSSLAWLVGTLAQDFPDLWFRLLYIQPEGITDELVATVKTNENICSYFDIPLQHSNETILKAMNRTGSGQEYLKLIKSLRQALPEVTLRTTVICGFPGETEVMFEELCDFIETAAFDYVGIFPYSAEEGTRAYGFEDQIDEPTKLERTQILRDLADSISSSIVATRIGLVVDVLICGREEDGQLFGRTQAQAPEVDGITYVDSGTLGSFETVKLVDSLYYDLEGETLG